MPYILYKTNGNTLAVVNDGSVDNSTSITFVGRNYSGYGEVQNENFLHLLENFANNTAPAKPVQGQIWFNSTIGDQNLNYSYDGSNFKSLANLTRSSSDPALTSTPFIGDMWWDTTNNVLKTWGSIGNWIVVGPNNSITSVASWQGITEYDNLRNPYNVLKGYIGYDPVVVISDKQFSPIPSSDLYANYPAVQPGITLKGAYPGTGSTLASQYYVWGTAAEALSAVTATNVVVSTPTTSTAYIPFVGTNTGSSSVQTTSSFTYNVSTGVMNAVAAAAQYADLAEKYLADQEYPVGTVVSVGGSAEVTACQVGDLPIGVVSANPAFMMNKDLVGGTYIALKGRVPVLVNGAVTKGTYLAAGPNGYAQDFGVQFANSPFAVALEDFAGPMGLVEAVVL